MSLLGIYRHYKGSLYHLMAIARHTETKEMMAVYRGLNVPDGECRTWVKPFLMFESQVQHNGKTMNCFTKVDGNPFDSPPDCDRC